MCLDNHMAYFYLAENILASNLTGVTAGAYECAAFIFTLT